MKAPFLHEMPDQIANALIGPVMDELPPRMVDSIVQDDIVQQQLNNLYAAGYVISTPAGDPAVPPLEDGQVSLAGSTWSVNAAWAESERFLDNGKTVQVMPAMLKRITP